MTTNDGHLLLCGQTASGKTTLLRRLAVRARSQGRAVIVATNAAADPTTWSWADAVVTEADRLVKLMQLNAGAFIVIDEAGSILGRHGKQLEAAILTARHRGHTVAVCAQRTKLVSPTVRDQCGRLFCFRVGVDDAADLVRQYGHAQLTAAASLPRGSFLTCTPWETVRRGKVF
jgi:hypothetical protein